MDEQLTKKLDVALLELLHKPLRNKAELFHRAQSFSNLLSFYVSANSYFPELSPEDSTLFHAYCAEARKIGVL